MPTPIATYALPSPHQPIRVVQYVQANRTSTATTVSLTALPKPGNILLTYEGCISTPLGSGIATALSTGGGCNNWRYLSFNAAVGANQQDLTICMGTVGPTPSRSVTINHQNNTGWVAVVELTGLAGIIYGVNSSTVDSGTITLAALSMGRDVMPRGALAMLFVGNRNAYTLDSPRGQLVFSEGSLSPGGQMRVWAVDRGTPGVVLSGITQATVATLALVG